MIKGELNMDAEYGGEDENQARAGQLCFVKLL
jgi:hypothetical protein